MDTHLLATSPAPHAPPPSHKPHPNSHCMDPVEGSHFYSQLTEIFEFQEQRENVLPGKGPKARVQLRCQVRGQKALVAQLPLSSCPTFPDLVEEFRMQYSPS